MAKATLSPVYEAQHYTVMVVYNPESTQAHEGKYWDLTYAETDVEGTGLGVAISPAVDLPENEFAPLGERLTPAVIELGGTMQKGDKLMQFDVRTQGRGENAQERLRVALWLMKKVVNWSEDYATYLRIAAGGYVPDPDEIPDQWFPIPNSNFAIYDPSPKDDPDNILGLKEGTGDEEEKVTNSDDEDFDEEGWTKEPALAPLTENDLRPPA